MFKHVIWGAVSEVIKCNQTPSFISHSFRLMCGFVSRFLSQHFHKYHSCLCKDRSHCHLYLTNGSVHLFDCCSTGQCLQAAVGSYGESSRQRERREDSAEPAATRAGQTLNHMSIKQLLKILLKSKKNLSVYMSTLPGGGDKEGLQPGERM